jgi:hypothetical protein
MVMMVGVLVVMMSCLCDDARSEMGDERVESVGALYGVAWSERGNLSVVHYEGDGLRVMHGAKAHLAGSKEFLRRRARLQETGSSKLKVEVRNLHPCLRG